MKRINLIWVTALSALAFSACSPSKSGLQKTLEENPEIVFNVIEKNPKQFIEVVNKAAQEARRQAQSDAAQQEQQGREDEFKNPKKPKIDLTRAFFGNKNAPVTIVEYSDFQCPYCSRGYNTIQQVKAEYGDKVRVLYKHLPLDFHPLAMPASKYYEAIALQSASKAEKFHDIIFENQSKLNSDKEKFLDASAKKAGANMAKLKKDINSEKVKKIIEEDIAEARKFGFSGTPGFLVNGVSLKGAYPFSEFKKIY